MNNCLEIHWEKKNFLARMIRDNEKKIETYKKKLKNPVNKRTGKPLAASTVKKYKMCLNVLEREVKNLKDFQNSLLKIDMGNNKIFPMPWRKHIFDIMRNGHQPFCENLIDIKKAISESACFQTFDLIKMTEFIFNYRKDNKFGQILSGLIIDYFKNVLDHIIEENSENQTPPKSKEPDVIDRIEKHLTDLGVLRPSSESIKEKSKIHHLSVAK